MSQFFGTDYRVTMEPEVGCDRRNKTSDAIMQAENKSVWSDSKSSCIEFEQKGGAQDGEEICKT